MKRHQPPVWAFRLVTEECERAGVKVPAIVWSTDDARQSHGNASPERGIRFFAGKDKKDQRMVLLHEIAHILVGEGHGHDAVFWDCAFTLFKRHRLAHYGLARGRLPPRRDQGSGEDRDHLPSCRQPAAETEERHRSLVPAEVRDRSEQGSAAMTDKAYAALITIDFKNQEVLWTIFEEAEGRPDPLLSAQALGRSVAGDWPNHEQHVIGNERAGYLQARRLLGDLAD